jgi:hypothetical protein
LRHGAALSVIALLLTGCGEDPKLKVRFYDDVQLGREILVSVPEDLNEPETARDAAQVRLQCFDRRARLIIDEAHPWPFEVDGVGDPLPHVHQHGPPTVLNQVVRCRLVGTDPPLEGELPLGGR